MKPIKETKNKATIERIDSIMTTVMRHHTAEATEIAWLCGLAADLIEQTKTIMTENQHGYEEGYDDGWEAGYDAGITEMEREV